MELLKNENNFFFWANSVRLDAQPDMVWLVYPVHVVISLLSWLVRHRQTRLLCTLPA